MLAERRRRPAMAPGVAESQHRRTDDLDGAERGVVEGGDDAGVAHLVVVERLARLTDRQAATWCSHSRCSHSSLGRLRRMAGRRCSMIWRSRSVSRLDICTAPSILEISSPSPNTSMARSKAPAAPVDLDQPTVGALVHAQEQPLVAEAQVARPALLVDRRLAVLGPPVHRVERQGAVAQRHVDVVAAPGAQAAAQHASVPITASIAVE